MIEQESLWGVGGDLQDVRQAVQGGGEDGQQGCVEQDLNQLCNILPSREHRGEIVVELCGQHKPSLH